MLFGARGNWRDWGVAEDQPRCQATTALARHMYQAVTGPGEAEALLSRCLVSINSSAPQALFLLHLKHDCVCQWRKRQAVRPAPGWPMTDGSSSSLATSILTPLWLSTEQ